MNDGQSKEGASLQAFSESSELTPPMMTLPTHEVILSQSSSFGDENSELMGEKILQNRHISFTTIDPIPPPQSTITQLDPPNEVLDRPRVIHRNHSLPIQSTVPAPIAPVATPQLGPTMDTPAGSGQQVVTKKKGRFKFVEQVPIQRPVNDTVLTNEIKANEAKPESIVTNTGITPNTSANNLHMLPPTHPPPAISIEGPAVVTTPIIQKKGRFVVTSLPAPTTLSVGGPTAMTSTLPQPPIPNDGGINVAPVVAISAVPQSSSHPFTANSMVVEGGALVPQGGAGFGMPTESSSIHLGVNQQTLNPLHPQQSASLGAPAPFRAPSPPPPPPNGHSPVQILSATNVPITESHSPSTSHVGIGTEELAPGMMGASYEAGVGSSVRQTPPLVSTVTSKPSLARAPTAPAAAAQRPHQQQGFGKMLYFLDQMKLEVTDADQKIKSLQTDMRCLVSIWS